MTETDTSFTSTLLPGARVLMYATDAQSVESFKALQSDWRFARVHMEHHQGGVEKAIETLKGGMASPDMLIIETDTIDESFTQQLEGLSNYCSENTAAIVIGPVNDVNLYRRLIGMGISDYLVRPVKQETLGFDIARTLIERLGASGSHLIAVLGAKGGVGATVIAESLAWGCADILGQKTVLIDAAGGWSTLSIGMNFEPATTLQEAVRAAASNNSDSFNRMLFHAHDKLDVLSSGGDVMLDETVDAASYERLIDKLMMTYPVIVVDLSDSPTALQRIVLSRAHHISLVTSPFLPSLRAARTLLNEMKNLRSDADKITDLVVSMAGLAPKQEVSAKDMEVALERKPAVTIPFNPGLITGTENDGRRMTATPEGAALVRSLLQMISRVLGAKGGGLTAGANDDGDKKNPFSAMLNKLKDKA
jgi:pilus assembly protein CpaE